MPSPARPTDKSFDIAPLCQQAIQEQHDRERRQGYGLDDYTEGRIVGAANLARKILRTLTRSSYGEPKRVGATRRSLAS